VLVHDRPADQPARLVACVQAPDVAARAGQLHLPVGQAAQRRDAGRVDAVAGQQGRGSRAVSVAAGLVLARRAALEQRLGQPGRTECDRRRAAAAGPAPATATGSVRGSCMLVFLARRSPPGFVTARPGPAGTCRGSIGSLALATRLASVQECLATLFFAEYGAVRYLPTRRHCPIPVAVCTPTPL